MSDFYQKMVEKASQAVEGGSWDAAIHYGKMIPPSWDWFQQIPSIATNSGQEIPDDAMNKILDLLSTPKYRENCLNSFLFELSSNLPKNASSEVLNRIANMGMEDHYVMDAVKEHPNFKPDQKTQGLLGASQMFVDYERKVEPHHFAAIQHHMTGEPVESYTNHRGETGGSERYAHVLPHIPEYAKKVQDAILKEAQEGYGKGYDGPQIKVKYFNGKPHVKVYRGLNGIYAQDLTNAAGYRMYEGTLERKKIKIPMAPMSSWTVDPKVAISFAKQRDDLPAVQPHQCPECKKENLPSFKDMKLDGMKPVQYAFQYPKGSKEYEHFNSPNHTRIVNHPMVISKYLPLEDVIHSGFHTVVPQQYHAHPHEAELVFKHPKGHIKVPTSNLHYVNVDDDTMAPLRLREPDAPRGDEAYTTVAKMELVPHAQETMQEIAESLAVQTQLGLGTTLESYLNAAKFLSGLQELPLSAVKKAFRQSHKPAEAALLACGLPTTDEYLKALEAIVAVKTLQKSEGKYRIFAAMESGTHMARELQSAVDDDFILPVQLSGKHSKGILLIRNEQEQKTYLLKPGSSGNSPAAGVNEETASQPRREACFYDVAKMIQLDKYMPECHLVYLNDKEYAAEVLLPWSYESLEEIRQEDPKKLIAILTPYRDDGTLHKWAAIDMILGNTDSHGHNALGDKDTGDVKLIDHGSAFAGFGFNVDDPNTFVPYYMRIFTEDFDKLEIYHKVRAMPQVTSSVDEQLRAWVQSIDSHLLRQTIEQYGISAEPSLKRLEQLQNSLEPISIVINKFWCGIQ